jgi:hypothetical protein
MPLGSARRIEKSDGRKEESDGRKEESGMDSGTSSQ